MKFFLKVLNLSIKIVQTNEYNVVMYTNYGSTLKSS